MSNSSGQHERPNGTEVARNPWGLILRYEEWRTLELRWLPTKMSDAAFKETLQLLAQMGEQYRPTFMIIDASEFRHDFGEGVMQWRDEKIIPRYNSAGVTKFAFLVPDGFPGTVESGGQPRAEGAANFPTAWFTKREHVYQWLAGG
jgi:hypothetical protein